MKRLVLFSMVSLLCTCTEAQKKTNASWSIAMFTIQNAKPFEKFSDLFSGMIHPGIELAYSKSWSIKKQHDWMWQLKLSYFYHRFVQHGIPLDMNIGYRYKFNANFSAQAFFGAGYMHSIPASGQFKLNNNGNYVNGKGAGRPQASANFSAGIGYVHKPSAPRPMKVFASWQQRVQMPFVKSYVPLLPYNSFALGINKPLR